MHTDQRETRHVVLEPYILCPVLFIVAARTILSLLSLVHVITLVAIEAIAAKSFIVQLASMACTAQQFRVSSL